MCQIFAGPSAKVKSTLLDTAGLLEALFDYNSDGWGAMYHTTSGVTAVKKLPKTAADTRKYVQTLPNDDRPVAVHWRMRTSGKIDMHNAHPHKADGGYVIHNGVLGDVDISSNPDLCDTIHFCRQYLDGNISAVVSSATMQRLVGEFIGNNRFVVLSDDGKMCIVNKHQGYEVNGVWVANTYASPPELLIPTYYKPRASWAIRRPAPRWDDADLRLPADTHGYSMDSAWSTNSIDQAADEEEFDAITQLGYTVEEALFNMDDKALVRCLEADPTSTIEFVLDNYYVEESRPVKQVTYPHIRQAWVDGDVAALIEAVPEQVAHTLLFCCNVEAAYA